jgi:hypothetical protein
MVARLLMASSRPQGLLVKWVAAGRAASSWVEGESTEVEVEAAAQAHAVEAWKSIDQLS